jgi:SAM-dependent methyltransferase
MKFNRQDELRKWLPKKNASILEIGPFFNPIFPKKEGFNTTTIDVFTKEKLIEIGKNEVKLDDNTLKAIEEVDLIWKGSLSESVSSINSKFDLICSSHNFEHQPNPLKFLMDVSDLLTENGVCSLAIPISSRCYDLFRDLSNTQDYLYRYLANRTKPSLIDIYDGEVLKVISNDIHLHKHHKYSIDELKLKGDSYVMGLRKASLLHEEFEHYYDTHISVLNPKRFLLIMYELTRLEFLPSLKIFELTENGHEFFAHLSKKREPLNQYNQDLRNIAIEDLEYQRREILHLTKKPNYLRTKYFYYDR